jgi:hypothetical protein
VVTAAGLVIDVVPVVPASDRLAVTTLPRNAKFNQEPWQARSNPCSPSERVLLLPGCSHTSPKDTNYVRSSRSSSTSDFEGAACDDVAFARGRCMLTAAKRLIAPSPLTRSEKS